MPSSWPTLTTNVFIHMVFSQWYDNSLNINSNNSKALSPWCDYILLSTLLIKLKYYTEGLLKTVVLGLKSLLFLIIPKIYHHSWILCYQNLLLFWSRQERIYGLCCWKFAPLLKLNLKIIITWNVFNSEFYILKQFEHSNLQVTPAFYARQNNF